VYAGEFRAAVVAAIIVGVGTLHAAGKSGVGSRTRLRALLMPCRTKTQLLPVDNCRPRQQPEECSRDRAAVDGTLPADEMVEIYF